MLTTGVSARQIALRHGLHPRVLSQHFQRHRHGLAGHIRAGTRGTQALAKARQQLSVLGESAALLARVHRVLEDAEKSGSHVLTLAAVREAKGLLDLIGRASGELTSGQQVTVAVGVNVERARSAVELVDAAESLSECELADRACEVLRLYNASHSEDQRTVLPHRGVIAEAEVVEAVDAAHDGEREAVDAAS